MFIDQLQPFYPEPGEWSMGFENRLKKNIHNLSPEVEKFSHHLGRRRKAAFRKAWKEFEAFSNQMNWNEDTAYKLYPEHRTEDKSPVEKFYKLLDGVILYAK